jgi:hypothetical protein
MRHDEVVEVTGADRLADDNMWAHPLQFGEIAVHSGLAGSG